MSLAPKNSKIRYQIGVDEVGRGPLAGPVTVCALAVSTGFNMRFFRGITDSKLLSEKEREVWFEKISLAKKSGLLDYKISHVGPKKIDAVGISRAVTLAVYRSLWRFEIKPELAEVFLDGLLRAPAEFQRQQTIIGGDRKNKIISAASVVAKVTRDRKMKRLAKIFPNYGFEIHKGYGTLLHRKAIKRQGLCEIHRRRFCG